MSSPLAIVPAAGASVRFGSMKLLADVEGVPLIGRTLASLFDAGISRVVLVAAPGHGLDAVPAVRSGRVLLVENPDPSRGMLSSIQVGLAAAEGESVLVLPGDMPFVASDAIRTIAAAVVGAERPVVPVVDGRRGHPLGIPARFTAGLLAQPASASLKDALRAVSGAPPMEIPVADRGVLRDVDVPDDLIGGAR